MAGMTTLGSTGISDYQNRTITIEVTGVRQQSVLKTSNYTVRVPYSQMSRAMQSINRQGGRVASVQLMGNSPVQAETAADASEDDGGNGEGATDKDYEKTSRRKRR